MISTLLLALALQSSLEARAREANCNDPQAQIEMNMCAGIDFERADAELNRAYREAIAGARQADREIDRTYDQHPSNETILREAQRAWVTFRDAQCTWEANGEARGGSMEPMVHGQCLARMTRERIAQLNGSEDPAH
jgi:uncharacterized protein YecT (DUF1311 family)